MARPTWHRVAARLVPYALVVLLGVGAYGALILLIGTEPIVWGRRWALGGLALVPLLALVSFQLGARRSSTMLFSRSADLAATANPFATSLVHVPRALRIVAIGVIVLALARPQRRSADYSEVEGIDIVVALDVSNSMSERDLLPNRLTAAQQVLARFVSRRNNDRIGLVIFGREAFTQCPLTLDHRALRGLLAEVRLELIDGTSTAIGSALATALNRLCKSVGGATEESEGKGSYCKGGAKSKVIILLTDGDNNAGQLAPEQVARYAQSFGVKIFTVLMGRDVGTTAEMGGLLPRMRYPVNPRLLEQIASLTGGTPYLATDSAALEQRFQAILDELDRSRLKEQRGRTTDLFTRFTGMTLALVLLELVLVLTRFRRFP